MKCFFCKAHDNEKRMTTYYAFVTRKNGTRRKVRWCRSCDESKADQIEQFLRETDDVQARSETG
jgi:hypothetical protein